MYTRTDLMTRYNDQKNYHSIAFQAVIDKLTFKQYSKIGIGLKYDKLVEAVTTVSKSKKLIELAKIAELEYLKLTDLRILVDTMLPILEAQ